MSKPSLLYSNARVKCFENSLLTSEKLTRMVFADNVAEAIKVLTEGGYGAGVSAENYDEILNEEEAKLSSFIAESMPPKSGMESFLIKNDYHNSKSLTKAKFMQEANADYMLSPQGLIEIDKLKVAINSDNFADLPVAMNRALTLIKTTQEKNTITPRQIDIILDKAMYEDIIAIAHKSKVNSIIKYWQCDIDFINITTFLRSRNIGKDYDFFAESFIVGGQLTLEMFKSCYYSPIEIFGDKIKYTAYGKYCLDAIIKSNMPLIEASRDNFLLDIFKKDKNDVFSIAPIAGYYVAKKFEIKQVRMICILLKNNIDKAQIKMRLRELYA